MNRLKQPGLFLLAFMFVLSACNKDEEINPGTPPELPPASSMEMDFSQFDDSGNSGGREMATNWESAALYVGFWSTVLTTGMIVPVASFKAAISQKASYDSDRGLWVWKFDHQVLGRTYSFELTGEVTDAGVEWNMYASEQNGFQNVLWYSGVMEADGSSGYWELNKDGNNPKAYLRIDWEIENEEAAYIKYENIEVGTTGFGAYIEYGKTAGVDFNRYYKVVGADGANVHIEWSTTSGAGRYQINGGAYFCWDTSFADVAC